jgi:hypothetical protein
MEESMSFLSNDEVESVRGKTGLNFRDRFTRPLFLHCLGERSETSRFFDASPPSDDSSNPPLDI